MPKRSLLIISIFLLAGVGYLSVRSTSTTKQSFPTQHQQVSPTISITQNPSTTTLSYCTPGDLQSTLSLSPGAGNVYGTFVVKNISSHVCQILGAHFITPIYDTAAARNITITHIGQTQSAPFVLSSNQSLYSQVHYPNGPQCQSIGVTVVGVTFTYQISPSDTIRFKNQNGKSQQEVQACKSPSDMTEIQLWQMAEHPITP